MNGTKEVEFRNYDDAAGFFYDETVEAKVWSNDLVMTSGYWVVDETLTIGDATGQDPEEAHNIVVSGDVKLIMEDGVSLTMRWDESFKMDAAEMVSSIGGTVSDIIGIATAALSTDINGVISSSGDLLTNVADSLSAMIENNEGTTVAMISVNEGTSLTVYGQENGTGKLDIQSPSETYGSNEGGAAIGGDSSCSNGAITINGGQVIAETTHQAAAIGGGANAMGHNITINGGYVNAQATDNKGAAIGGGAGGGADNITINGGYIYTYAWDHAAAIGGATDGEATNITINGGHIYAKARSGGAAIGGGYGTNNGTSGYFTINNGYVDAHGGDVDNYHSPAIGRGAGSSSTITQIKINGGSVYCMVKSDKSEVIGKGYSASGDSTGLYFKGVYLSTGMRELGDQNGSIDYFTNDDYKECIQKGESLTSYATQGEDTGTGFSGDKTASSAGYYADTIDGGFYHVSTGYYFANTEAASIKGLNNNGYYIKGGAIFNEGGYLDLYSVTISNNKSRSNGSAVQNGSALGGAIYANGGTSGYTVVSYSKFENNVTTGSTGDFRGGAIASEQDILTVTGSVFNSNKTTSQGGAIWANGTNVVIDDSEFNSNYASYGGAVYAEGIQTIVNDTFTGNLAGIAGGAVYAATGSTVVISNSDFEANSAHSYNYNPDSATAKDLGTHRGGAVYVAGDKEQGSGATVYISGSDFTGNYAKQGGAIYVAAYGNATVSNADFIKNDAGEHGGAIYVEKDGKLNLNDVYFSGNRSTVYDDDGNEITEYCAIYNEGEINFTGSVTVDSSVLDKVYNRNCINWDLTGGQSNGYFSDLTCLINETEGEDIGSFGLTVNADDLGGISRYVLGQNANLADMPASLKAFVLRGIAGQENTIIEINGSEVEYNGKMYKLTASDKAEDYYELVLTVTDKAGTPARTGHIVVTDILNASGKFENFDFGEAEGGIVLVEDGGTFAVHDSIFTANKAEKGGAIYVKAGGKAELTDVTFNGNISEDGQSGAMYIEKGASATMYGSVTLGSTTDTIYNEGELVWNIGLITQGYVSDFSCIVNEGTLAVECDVDTQYGKYKLAGNALSADGEEFTVLAADGTNMTLTVGGSSAVNGDYAWRLYVDSEQKNALCLSIEASRIVVKEDENYTLSEDYSIDMTNAGSCEGNGQVIEVQKGGSLSTAKSAKIIGCSATVSGGAIWNRGAVSLDNTRLFNNTAESGNGGAIYDAENAKLTISNSTLRGNKASGNGGAIADDAAGTITVTNTTFADNSAANGGAVAITDGKLNLAGVIFNGNTASGKGGAISVSGTGSVNLYGSVTLATESDTIDLGDNGKLMFNLSLTDGSGYLSDFSKVTGVKDDTITINVNDDDTTSALYVLADNASGLGNVTCSIIVPTSTTGVYATKEITVNTKAVSSGDYYYSLTINDEDQLVLQSMKRMEVSEDCVLASDIDINLKGTATYAESGMLIEVQTGGVLENTGSLKFANCSAEKAGGVIYNEGTTILTNAEFTGNMSNVGKDSYIGGGAIASTGDLTISNSTFSNNVVRGASGRNGEGGAIYQSGGTISISDTEFTNNKSEFVGGAIYAGNTNLTLSGTVTFEGNSAESDNGGNAIRMFQSTLTIAGDVYLNGNDQTIRIDDNSGPYSTIEWIVGENANGYLSDFSKISTCASKSIYQFSIDASTLVKWEQDGEDEQGQPVYVMAEGPALGKSYLLADNAANATSFGNFILKYASSTYGVIATDELTLNKAFKDETTNVWYSLTLNSDNELALSTINHIVVTVDEIARPSGVYTMEKGDNYNWAGMDTWVGSGAIFEVKDDGTLNNEFGATVQNGYATGNGGAVYSEGELNLKGTRFFGNNAEGSGGAIFNMGEAVLKGVSFKGNTAVGCGGAIYNDEDATLSIGEAIFNGNTAFQAGAIYNLGVLNITGSIMLMTANDTIVSAGDSAVINWALNDTVALTRNTDFSISDFAKVSGDGSYTITLNENSASQMSGLFKLASNAANGITVDVWGMSGLDGAATMEVASACRLVSQVSTDKKVYYELLMDENNDLYFTVDQALFLNDSWGDTETGLEVTFHGNTITGSNGDGTFFNKTADAAKVALNTNATVFVYGLEQSSVLNFQSKYTLEGSVMLSSEYAWVNAGTTVRDAVVNWDLAGKDAEDGICINGFENYHNGPTTIDEEKEYLVKQTVTVTNDQAEGRYVLASGDLSDAAADETGKYDFTLVSMYDKTGTDLALNQVTEYNGKYYSFYVDDVGTADETDDELVLNVDSDAKITIKVDNISVMYDGQNHKVSYTVIGSNLLLDGDTLEVTLSDTEGLTNAGSIETISVESYKVMRGSEDVTGQYQFNDSIDGSLEVYKRDITITTGSATKRYDGTALTCSDYTVTGSGFAEGQGATYEVTGSQTEIGSSYNTITCTLDKGTSIENYDISFNYGELTVQPASSITITASSDSKMYDGTELTGSCYITEGSLISGDELVATVTGSLTDAGTADNVISEYKIMRNGADVTKCYAVTTVKGTLEVTKRDVTLTSSSDSKMYDGNTLEGTVTVSGSGFVDGEATVTASSITDAGSITNTITINKGAAYKDSNYNITNNEGTLEVTKRDVTLTSGDAAKVYDGTALTNSTVTVSGTGWLEGEGATYDVTGTQTKAGSSANTFTYTVNAGTKADNYEVSMVEGTLTVNPTDTLITITADSSSKMYDGSALTCGGYTVTGDLVAGDTIIDVVVAGSITHVGDTANTVISYKIVNTAGEDVTASYSNVQKVEGKLSITKRDVTITSGSASKGYDGTALTCDTITVSGTGFVDGEGATYTVTGSQTEPGSSANTFSYTLNNGTFADDYAITQEYGTLSVGGVRVTISGTTVEDKVYDGTTDAVIHAGTLTGVREGDDVCLKAVGSFNSADAGKKTVTVTYTLEGKDSYKYEAMVAESFSASITVRQVLLESASDSKVYDGTPLTNSTVTVSGDGWLEGEGATYTVTGSQTEIGSSANTFSYALNEGTNAANYSIYKKNGTLTVESPAVMKAARNDLNGNNISDVVFQYTGGDRQLGYWMDGTNEWLSGNTGALSENWTPAGAADMNADGKADVVMTGTFDNSTLIGYYKNGDGSDWTTLGAVNAADVNVKLGNMTGNDNCNSVVFHSAVTGELTVWEDGDAENSKVLAGSLFSGWELTGTGDFNGDGAAEAVLANGGFYSIDMDGKVTNLANLGAGWEIKAIGDFNNDGTDDLVIFNEEFNLLAKLGSGKGENFEVLGQLDSSDWFVAGAGDYDGDLKDDLLVRQNSTGMLGYYAEGDMNKWNTLGYGVDMNWTVIA